MMEVAEYAGLVSREGAADPSVGTVHTSLCRRFSASTMWVRTNTALRPSGDSAGAETVMRR